MRNNMLEIRYTIKDQINIKLDQDIRTVANKHGFEFSDSGYDFEQNIRDLRFERSSDNKKTPGKKDE